MPDATSPQATADDTMLTFSQGVEDITDLLNDPETDLEEEDQDQEAKAEGEEEGSEPDAEADAGNADPVDDESDDGSGDIKGGRFAPDSAKVTLDDGTVITVGDLRRNNLYQRDYTRKTTELKQERETFEQQKEFVGKHAQAIAAQRNFLLSVSQKFLPQAPDRSMLDPNSGNYDPIGFTQAKAEYDEKMTIISQLQYASQAEQARMTEEQTAQRAEMRRQEAENLFSKAPEFKNPETYQRFWTDAVKTMAEEYGWTEQEINEAEDHRFYLAMRDLVKYHKARKQAPKVKEQVQAKPKLISGGKRMDPKAKTSRDVQARREQLRKTGSFEAGIAALMDLDL